MSDAISREEAIRIVRNLLIDHGEFDLVPYAVSQLRRLRSLPSVRDEDEKEKQNVSE